MAVEPSSAVPCEPELAIDTPRDKLSPFLRLPAELRVQIYVYVARSEEVALRCSHGGATSRFCEPSLLSVCHQTRDEYASLWRTEATAYAPLVILKFKNFPECWMAQSIVCALSAEARRDVERKFVVHLHVDNRFERSHVKSFVGGYSGQRGYSDSLGQAFQGLQFAFSPDFDAAFARTYLMKTGDLIRSIGSVRAVSKWREFEKEFRSAIEAFERDGVK